MAGLPSITVPNALNLRAALMLWIDAGELHKYDCPQDDTCGCKVAVAVNAALSPPPASGSPAGETDG